MRKLLLSVLLIGCATFAAYAQVAQDKSEVIRRGEKLTGAEAVKLADLLQSPQKYGERTIAVDGVIERVCTNKGCWMEIAPQSGADGMRVTFKNYGFFVPVTSKGLKAKAEGRVVVKTLSREQADHYAGEGAEIKREADGTAREVTFVADGVELRKTE